METKPSGALPGERPYATTFFFTFSLSPRGSPVQTHTGCHLNYCNSFPQSFTSPLRFTLHAAATVIFLKP